MKSFLVRLPEDLLERFDASAKKGGKSRNAAVVEAMSSALDVISTSSPNPASKEQVVGAMNEISRRFTEGPRDIATCPHKYRVQKGEKTVCPACGDER